ncbi:MAG TPA: hypothetical protein VHC69_17770 [Polyangiaceae bacterium]|nr:hypothetical protein [Polyangiaceae bacterium]
MTTLRAFTSALVLAAFVAGPAHAEMVSATKPPSKTESAKTAKQTKNHADKKKHASADKKARSEGVKASKEKPHHAAAKTAHATAKPAKKHEHAAAKAKPSHDAHKDARPDKRVASRDRQKERHGSR